MPKNPDQDSLIKQLSDRIGEIDRGWFQITDPMTESESKAFIAEYNVLQAAYYELVRAKLDANNSTYDDLMKKATAEANDLRAEVRKLNDIVGIINAMASVVNVVGRLLLILGI